MFVFGPIPSGRFGLSLGISNVAHGWCTYDCVYCGAGPTVTQGLKRSGFHGPAKIEMEVEQALGEAQRQGESVDHLVICPDGEPCLDTDLGATVEALKCFGLPLVVMTNGSLLNRDDVRRDLRNVDWVALKIDAGDETTWRRLNRPHDATRFSTVFQGMRSFAGAFDGFVSTETVLVDEVNTSRCVLEATADLCACLKPDMAYLSTPIELSSEPRCRPPGKTARALAETIFSERLPMLSLPEVEPGAPSSRGDPRHELLALIDAQPMKVRQVEQFLTRAGLNPSTGQDMVRTGLLCRHDHFGEPYYVRCHEGDGCQLRRCSVCPPADSGAAAC